ncbi:MAG TPA: hypothetical protein VHX65_04065 [Pirellulales bacterium]|jgi:hypothetical protein|nr:hypothetical protein [Pirellulales bacterium]
MNKLLLSGLAAIGLALGLASHAAAATPYPYIYWHSLRMPWHTAYADETYGQPIALVVPPTVGLQAQYGWGVCGTRITPIYHQFARPYPGPGAGYVGRGFLPTPEWPSDTTQFGVYYIRGPW